MPPIFRYLGDKLEAVKWRQYGLFLLGQTRQLNQQGLSQFKQRYQFPDGTVIICHIVPGLEFINIYPAGVGAPTEGKTVEISEDVFIAFNVPDRNGAWDLDDAQRITGYKQDVPTPSWEQQSWNGDATMGDPVVYYWPHTLAAANDSRFNILKTWTYNLQTTNAEYGDWVAEKSITVFHRKSISFNDIIRGYEWPYVNYTETIDVYLGSATGVSRAIISEWWWGPKNFYIAPDGTITTVYLWVEWVGPGGSQYAYKITKKIWATDGTLQSTTTYQSETWNPEYVSHMGPMGIAYDGTDFYVTVGVQDDTGYPKVEFAEEFIYTSATKLYDYDFVDRVVVSMDKTGYVTGDSPPTLWFLAFQFWYDFARREWHCLDMLYQDEGGGNGTWTCMDGAITVFEHTGVSDYPGDPYPWLDDQPTWWCFYAWTVWADWDPINEWYIADPALSFPTHTDSPWNLHFTVGGYRRLNTQATFDDARAIFDQTAVFSQKSGTRPDTTAFVDNYYRGFTGPVITDKSIVGEEAKWTTNGPILQITKTEETTVVE